VNRIALVHHANQFVITDGYENRDGISTILDGYEGVLAMHERHRIPLNLHLSGTLLEAVAWHRPGFLHRVADLVTDGLVTLVGGTYAENIMPLFSNEFNRAQLAELFDLYATLLNCAPQALSAFWAPERVWDPRLAGIITDPSLPNGGYRYVLLDDRLWFPPGRDRRVFDLTGPWAGTGSSPPVKPCRIDESLTMLPISAQLRYRIPPSSHADLQWIESSAEGLLVYADDLEKTAGVGGWANDIADYERFLKWLERTPALEAIHLDEIPPASEERPIEAGTFYELASRWNAGEDYSGWAESPAWAPYRSHLRRAEEALRSPDNVNADHGLRELARKHLLASAHETAWHDEVDGVRAPAPWVRAIAGRARAVHPILLAARSLPAMEKPVAYSADVDADGLDEVVLGVPNALCVLTAHYGGRIAYLFHDGVMSIGNPTDHSNFQEELNRFMDKPPNHPGALVDLGAEHDVYELASRGTIGDLAVAELTTGDIRKTVALSSTPPGLVACYSSRRAVQSCLSPDYLRLLRSGRRAIGTTDGKLWRRVCTDNVSVWIAIKPDEAEWITPTPSEAGHGLNFEVSPRTRHWHMAIGWGPVDDAVAAELIDVAVLLHD
jgi:starch synthase